MRATPRAIISTSLAVLVFVSTAAGPEELLPCEFIDRDAEQVSGT